MGSGNFAGLGPTVCVAPVLQGHRPLEDNLRRTAQLQDKPRRGRKIISGGASPRIGCCIYGAPAGAKIIGSQHYSGALPGLRTTFRSNPGFAPGAILFPPRRGLFTGRSEFRNCNQLRCLSSRGTGTRDPFHLTSHVSRHKVQPIVFMTSVRAFDTVQGQAATAIGCRQAPHTYRRSVIA